jgi:hypothetical protein
MKKVLVLLIISLITFAGINAQGKKKAAKIQVLNVENFEKKAEKLVGKEVFLTGTCDHVCKHAGKKLHLVGKNDTKVEIMASEKIGKFPKELEGEDLKVKGTIMMDKIDEEYLKEWEAEVKEHHKEGTENCENDMAKIKKMRDKMKKNKLGYVPIYHLEGISYEKF